MNEDYVELWLVRGAYVVGTPAEGLFEVVVLAKRLYRSRKAFSSGEFPVAADHWSFNKVRDSGWFVAGIDLAYAYVYTGDSSFHCLGKVLELECLIRVETINLPEDVMEKITDGRSPDHHISLQSFDLLPPRPRCSSNDVPSRVSDAGFAPRVKPQPFVSLFESKAFGKSLKQSIIRPDQVFAKQRNHKRSDCPS
jgi:hypothetical protein